MMKAISVVAVGLLIAMALMMNYGQDFFTWWLSSATFHSWAMAIATISPPTSNIAGMNVVGAAAFIAGSLGVGLLLSTILFGVLNMGFHRLVDLPRRRLLEKRLAEVVF